MNSLGRVWLTRILPLVLIALLPARSACADTKAGCQFTPKTLPLNLTIVRGTQILVSDFPGEIPSPETYVLKRGGAVRVSTTTDGNWFLEWDTSNEPLGFARVTVCHRLLTGQDVLLARSSIEIVDKPLFTLQVSGGDKPLAGVVPVRIVAANAEKIKQVRIRIDGRPLPLQFGPDGSAVWDVWTELKGKQTLDGLVETNDTVFPLPPVTVEISSPVEAVPFLSGSTLLLSIFPEEVTLHARINPAAKIRSAEYHIDNRVVLKCSEPPFDTAVWRNANETTAGTHQLRVAITDEQNRTFWSDPYQFTVQFKDITPRPTPKVFDGETAEPPLLKHQGTHDFDALRREAAAVRAGGRRQGQVGRVNGLAVLITTLGGEPISASGSPLTVEASWTVGAGTFSFLANAAADATVAAERAFAFAKRKMRDLGFAPDWARMDVTVSYVQNDVPSGGPSAGVADTVALLSSFLRLPVDRDVAMTGAIGLSGQVDPVGGVYFKAESAFGQSNVRTLIVPASVNSLEDFMILAELHPDLIVGRRLILVHNVEEVLRQALIGYDGQRLAEAEQHFVNGLHAFGQHADILALRELEQAYSRTPENATIVIWYNLIKQASRTAP